MVFILMLDVLGYDIRFHTQLLCIYGSPMGATNGY